MTSKKFKIGKHRAGKTKDANQTKMKKKSKYFVLRGLCHEIMNISLNISVALNVLEIEV